MPLKKSKTPKEVEELIEMFQAKIDRSLCGCSMCVVDKAMSQCDVDALRWSLGGCSKEFSEVVAGLMARREIQTKHQHSHAE